MKKTLTIAISIIVACAIVGGLIYFGMGQSEYEDVDWNNYEHTDAYDSHYYKDLTVKEKIAYENIMAEYMSFPERIEIPELNNKELTNVFTAILYDNPTVFCYKRTCSTAISGNRTYFVPEYAMTKAEYESRLQELQSLTPEILSGLPSGEYAVELYLHDYIIDNCTYSDTKASDESNIYGALILGKASCEGYARAMKYLCDQYELETYLVLGNSTEANNETGSHMWNIIKIDNEYYHLDVTWNDTISQDDNCDDKQYMYFNLSDDEISNTHSDYKAFHECKSDSANYYVREKLYFTSFGENEKNQLASIIAQAAFDGRTSVAIKFSSNELFEKTSEELLGNQQIYAILSRADKLSVKSIDSKKILYRSLDDVNVLEIIFTVG